MEQVLSHLFLMNVTSLGSRVANMSDITASDPSVIVVIGSSMVVYVGSIVTPERQASSISLAV